MDREDLARTLLARGIGDRVVTAMLTVPRDRFLPARLRARAWEDHALGIGYDQTISQPTVVAVMTEAADVGPGDNVLDVGTGSGYQAAVLAACGARVHSIERIPQLAERARRTLAELAPAVQVLAAEGTAGMPRAAPFDAIVVAAATTTVPPALIEQLREPGPSGRGGRLVIPVGRSGAGAQELMVFTRGADGMSGRKLLDVVFVPLIWPG